jgi:NAD-dependent SIR2 family protein deacetylase
VDEKLIRRAAELVASADALIIGAGAGMGVDSGLPDFRGDHGFWRAYPPYQKLGLNFAAMANPRWFDTDPALAWGFYGHRRNLYRATQPHDGFRILRDWAAHMKHGAFVFTSNVDGHFQRAGFDAERIVEIHGSIEWLQCVKSCEPGATPAGPERITLDEETLRAGAPLPSCASCGELARPNILMFGDWDWDDTRTNAQHSRLDAWLRSLGSARFVLVECGAGTAIPTVRRFNDSLAATGKASLLRINVREPSVPPGQLGIAAGALEALRAIDAQLARVRGGSR